MSIHQGDVEFLERKIISLENEARALKQTLRDGFAGLALQGMIAHGWQPPELVVEQCYQLADLMILERAK